MANLNPEKKSNEGLIRKLGLFDSTMIVMGIIIGGGIFYTTGIMAQTLPSAMLILLAWTIGGLLSLAGALIYAELGAAMPEAGGQYVYISRAYGPLSGFLFGWITCLAFISGVIAVLGVAFSEYFSHFFPFLSPDNIIFSSVINIIGHDFHFSLSMGQIAAIVLITLFSISNFIGLGFGKTIQNIFSVIKIGTIVVFIVLGFTLGKGTPIDFSLNPTGLNMSQLISGLSVALVTASIAFAGWENLNYII